MELPKFLLSDRTLIRWIIGCSFLGILSHFFPLINIIGSLNVYIFQTDWAMYSIPLLFLSATAVYTKNIDISKATVFLSNLVVLIFVVITFRRFNNIHIQPKAGLYVLFFCTITPMILSIFMKDPTPEISRQGLDLASEREVKKAEDNSTDS